MLGLPQRLDFGKNMVLGCGHRGHVFVEGVPVGRDAEEYLFRQNLKGRKARG